MRNNVEKIFLEALNYQNLEPKRLRNWRNLFINVVSDTSLFMSVGLMASSQAVYLYLARTRARHIYDEEEYQQSLPWQMQ